MGKVKIMILKCFTNSTWLHTTASSSYKPCMGSFRPIITIVCPNNLSFFPASSSFNEPSGDWLLALVRLLLLCLLRLTLKVSYNCDTQSHKMFHALFNTTITCHTGCAQDSSINWHHALNKVIGPEFFSRYSHPDDDLLLLMIMKAFQVCSFPLALPLSLSSRTR